MNRIPRPRHFDPPVYPGLIIGCIMPPLVNNNRSCFCSLKNNTPSDVWIYMGSLSPPPPPRTRPAVVGYDRATPCRVFYMDVQTPPPVNNRDLAPPPPPPSTIAFPVNNRDHHPPPRQQSRSSPPPPPPSTIATNRGTGTSNPVMSRRIHTASAFRDYPTFSKLSTGYNVY